MGNWLPLGEIFGGSEDSRNKQTDAGNKAADNPLLPPNQGWCLNTWQYGLRNGEEWTTTKCEVEMKKDVENVLANIDEYLFDLEKDQFPDDAVRVKNDIVLTSYNNRSNTENVTNNFGDDGLWTLELQSRVANQFDGGYEISADEKRAIFRSIERKSKLSRRTSYNRYKGNSNDSHYGEVESVFGFTGRA